MLAVEGIRQLFRLRVRLAECVDADGLDDLIGLGAVVAVGLDLADRVDGLDAARQLAEGGILLVEMGRILMHDEELRAAGVRRRGTRHGEHAALVLQGVIHAIEEEFALDAIAGASHARSLGAAALNHEAGDHAVEDQPVIEAGVCKADEIINALRRGFRIKLGGHDRAVFHFDGSNRMIHRCVLSFIARSI